MPFMTFSVISASNPGLIELYKAFDRSTHDYESGHEDLKIQVFKVNFLCQKSSESFHFFSLKNTVHRFNCVCHSRRSMFRVSTWNV